MTHNIFISKSNGRFLAALSLAATVCMLGSTARGQQTVLFHGGQVEATQGSDGEVFDFLVDKLGEGNVTYMQGDQAAADGSSANGFDAVIISSTLGSGSVRNKYADLPLPLLNWEQALTRQAGGEFNLSVGGRTNGGSLEIDIVDSDHFITSGLEGTIEVVNVAQIFSLGTGEVAAGVQLLADLAGSPDDHAIMVAEPGAELLGNGSAGSPAIAPARRAFLFLEDSTFAEINEIGLAIVDRTIDWILQRDLLVDCSPGDFNCDGQVDMADFQIMTENFNESFPILESFEKGDQTRDGKVDLADFLEVRGIFNAAQVQGATASVPEPTGLTLVLSGVVISMLSVNRRRRQRMRAS